MPGIVFKLFGFAVIAVTIVYMLASAFRQSRRIDARFRALKKEEEELARQGRVKNPYAELAEIYAEKEGAPKTPRGRKGGRS